MNNVAAKKCTDSRILAGRPAHPLNDKSVRLRPDAVQTPRFKNGTTLCSSTKTTTIGIVQVAADGRAVVDFGQFYGHAVCLVVAEKDLEVVS